MDHGALTGLVATVSTSAIVPVFDTLNQNGALPVELVINGLVYDTDFASRAMIAPEVAALIWHSNLPTSMFSLAVTESVNWALTPAPIRPTARANPARSPTIFRTDITLSLLSCLRYESWMR
jgi:hypothetical protein